MTGLHRPGVPSFEVTSRMSEACASSQYNPNEYGREMSYLRRGTSTAVSANIGEQAKREVSSVLLFSFY